MTSKITPYGTGMHEAFTIEGVTHDEEGIPWGQNAFVHLQDNETGESWNLTSSQAHKLGRALMLAARDVNKAKGRLA
jgi:hypothetical protein